ncbi:MAG: polymer-forming cytoskeletal protein [Candidatus Aminicenantaceae bacterium]
MIGKGEDKIIRGQETSLSSSPTPQTSIVSQTLLLEGDISGKGDLVIHGQVRGKIRLVGHGLTVARTGRVKADILADNVLIQGTVEGRIQAAGKVTLHAESSMSGDITAARISIAEGAVFKGSLKIQSGL